MGRQNLIQHVFLTRKYKFLFFKKSIFKNLSAKIWSLPGDWLWLHPFFHKRHGKENLYSLFPLYSLFLQPFLEQLPCRNTGLDCIHYVPYHVYESLSCVRLFAIPWTVACQAPLSIRFFQAKILEWVATPFSRGSSQPRDQTQVSCIAGGFFTIWATREASS